MSNSSRGRMPTTDYWTVEAYYRNRYRQLSRQAGLKAQTRAELHAWQDELRARLRAITGIDSMRHCPLMPEIGAIEQLDGYTRQWVAIATEPGIRMPIYVLVP